jgi:hypoxanthine phosphoribosyltransferase
MPKTPYGEGNRPVDLAVRDKVPPDSWRYLMAPLPTCFFISPIGEKDSPERKHAEAVTKHIVKKAANGMLRVVRGDQMAKPGVITSEIVRSIDAAPMVAADLTFLNANVFYELALRHQTGLPYVQIAAQGTKLPFDVTVVNTVFFDLQDLDSVAAAVKDMRALMKSGMETGYVESPVTVAEAGLAPQRADAYGWTAVQRLLGKLMRKVRRDFQPDLIVTMAGPGSIPAFLQQMTDERDTAVAAAITFPTGTPDGAVTTAAESAAYLHVATKKWEILLPPVVGALPPGSKVLLLDDRMQSGESHRLVKKHLANRKLEVKSAVLVASDKSGKEADWYAEKRTGSFSFPWGDQEGRHG